MLIVTLPSIPGYDTRLTLGPVMVEVGVQPNMAEGYKMAFSAMAGRNAFDLPAMRNQAMNELVRQAAERGANALLGLSFNMMQVYATAALIRPVSDDAMRQYDELVRAGHIPPLT